MRFLLVAFLWLIALGTVNVASAETLQELTTLCQKGNASGCFNLGVRYSNGTGVKQDSFKAVELYRKACDGQEALGCSNLGRMYDKGEGVTQDSFKALELYRKACDGQDAEGCANLGKMYEHGDPVTQDFVKAVELYREACDGQNAKGCGFLGVMYANGEGVRQSVEDALKFYDKGCKLGDKNGCTEHAKLVPQGEMPRATPPTSSQHAEVALNNDRKKLAEERNALAKDRQQLEQERRRQEVAKASSSLSLHATATSPDQNGVVQIMVRANAETSSLTVNGEEAGGKSDGNYTLTRVAKVGQDTTYTIVATDMYGKTDSKIVTVSRQTLSQAPVTVSLKLEDLPRRSTRDAVAIIIGIQNYKRVPKADFANADARDFFEYAVRGLGINPAHTKLLVDEDADDVNIVKAFKNWLPLHVTKNKTDVYVFYSGHGLPSTDGKSLYLLPYGVDKDLLARTAVGQEEVVAALVAAAPKSVTMFIDACYSGQTRSGEQLLASARPFVLKMDEIAYPSNFTVISASSQDQISSSSPELKHGIFSFYLMKGMEGQADGNKDGTITAGEMQAYLSDKVSRQAMGMNRQQDTQLVGDAARVLVGR